MINCRNTKYKSIIFPEKIANLEKVNLSEAYSDLKDKYMEIRGRLAYVTSTNKLLKKENEDYSIRYNHLIQYLNKIDEQ